MTTGLRAGVPRACLVLGALLVLWIVAPAAHAGQWIQVSCTNPDGSPATSEGWSMSSAGSPPPGSGAVTQCGPTTPLSASLSSVFAAAPVGATETLQYTPPAGSTLAGGTLQVDLSSDSTAVNSADAVSETTIYSPAATGSDVLISCIPYLSYCPTGTKDSAIAYTGPVTIPAGAGGGITVIARCDGGSGDTCAQGGTNGDWALSEVTSADLLLASEVSPTGTGFSGSALQRGVRGTGHVVFTAADGDGPGVYSVSVAIDGRTVWSGQPDENGGQCVAAGTGAGGALMFDDAQPCLDSETVDAPVPTAGLPDGRHELTIAVTDAAQNTATVLDRTITTSNPIATPAARGGLRTRFYFGWRWSGRHTRLVSARVARLPRNATVSVTCRGRGCPRLRGLAVSARRVRGLLHVLQGDRFRSGDRLFIAVTARRRRAERIELTFRSGREPRGRLVSGSHHRGHRSHHRR